MSYRTSKTGKPEFEPTSVATYRPAKPGARVHMRAMHLATVKQIGGTR